MSSTFCFMSRDDVFHLGSKVHFHDFREELDLIYKGEKTYRLLRVGGVAYGTPRNASTGLRNLKLSKGNTKPCSRP